MRTIGLAVVTGVCAAAAVGRHRCQLAGLVHAQEYLTVKVNVMVFEALIMVTLYEASGGLPMQGYVHRGSYGGSLVVAEVALRVSWGCSNMKARALRGEEWGSAPEVGELVTAVVVG